MRKNWGKFWGVLVLLIGVGAAGFWAGSAVERRERLHLTVGAQSFTASPGGEAREVEQATGSQAGPCSHKVLYGDELVETTSYDLLMPVQRKAQLLEAAKSGGMGAAVVLSDYSAMMARPEAAYYWAKKAHELGWDGITKEQIQSKEERIYQVTVAEQDLPEVELLPPER